MPNTSSLYTDVILPLALPRRTYTYKVPEEWRDAIRPGVRVEVPFGSNKLYSGLVERVHSDQPEHRLKSIVAVLDEVSVVTNQQLRLWDWMADYYCCTLGEVMAAALPGHLKLTSQTQLVVNPAYGDDFSALDNDEYLIAEALLLRKTINIDDARKILNKKTIFPIIQRLLQKGVLFLQEDLQEKYKPRKVMAVRFAEPYKSDQELLGPVLNELDKYEKQTEIVMALIHLNRSEPFVRRQVLLEKASASDTTLRSLVKKGIVEVYERAVSRISAYDEALENSGVLSTAQSTAVTQIETLFQIKDVVLLHGVTGSGKTRLYIEHIRKTMAAGGQTLYLLPEIALTTQMIQRLQRVFGESVVVYHSKINYNERVELWAAVATGRPVVLAARSGLFLPFKDLRLIVVDEEHDPSFKQYDPAPRYHARDTAIYLAKLYGAKVLLGTATPSLESYHNAQSGKYGLVPLDERFGGLALPDMQTIDLRKQLKNKQMQGIFSTPLIDAIKNALTNGEQVILFQNRRGYAPLLSCQTCQWNAMCKHCDISLTYHKSTNSLRCHYCGYQEVPVSVCPACGSGKITLLGSGTEKIEEDLRIVLPEARIARMDLDTAGSKGSLTALLNDFEERRVDILVGTQMVTKGLDFDNVGIVGVLGTDQLLKFPDFRAGERAFHLLTQVAGRAGRKNKRGTVLIQAFNPEHPILLEVLKGQFVPFAKRELDERAEFRYPPYFRLIHLTIQHKDEKTAHAAAEAYAKMLRPVLNDRLLGPVTPPVPRLRSYYGQQLMLKIEKNAVLLARAKTLLKSAAERLYAMPGFSQVKLGIDVDPV
jgi:primosomal protein N' (replication factor Y) (superfamily II helicase)